MKKKSSNKKAVKTYGIMAIGFLVMVLGVFTYGFIKYNSKSYMNNNNIGKISYSINPSDSVILTNVYPIDSEELINDVDNNQSVTITINGSTNYDEDVEYLIRFDQVDNIYNGKTIPISFNAAVSNLGEETKDYFNSRNRDNNVYQLIDTGDVYSNEKVLMGYIRYGEININGSVTITSYIDSDKVVVADSNSLGDIFADAVFFNSDEWNEIREKGISFKLRVDIKEGIWIEEN